MSPDSSQPSPAPAELALDPTSALKSSQSIFHLSPLVRLTLLSLYGALTIPLPFLADVSKAPIPGVVLWVGIAIGFGVLYGALTERVKVDQAGIEVTYAPWVPRFFRSGWQLAWADITALKPRTTGQGGLVYYFVSRSQQAYLLPMRVVGFARLVQRVQAETGIDTTDVRPLAQPWMYLILLGLTVLLGLVDSWAIWTAITLNAGM
jgi:hypothetical protein